MMPYKLSFVAKLAEVDSRFNACGAVQSFEGSATGEAALVLAEAMGIALPEHAVTEMTPAPEPEGADTVADTAGDDTAAGEAEAPAETAVGETADLLAAVEGEDAVAG
jgi:hypothetical protein